MSPKGRTRRKVFGCFWYFTAPAIFIRIFCSIGLKSSNMMNMELLNVIRDEPHSNGNKPITIFSMDPSSFITH